MLTLKNISATVAKTYFEKGYYQQGRWFGKAAAQLKLKGEIIDKTAYNNLLDAYSPGGKKRLMGRSVKSQKHRAAIDCIFNAPKSVSLQALVGKDERLIEAHRKAVNETLKLMESRYAHSRKAEKGQKQRVVRTGKLAIAQFDHIETRDLDPHLHTHCVVMNVTPRVDGKWRSLHNDAIYRHQKLLGMVYQHNLALEVQKLGYQVVGKGHGQFEIVGYPEKDLKHFSKRRQAILATVGEKASFEERNRAWGNTRVKKEIVEPEELKARWQQEAQALKIEFVTFHQVPVESQNSISQKTIADAVEHCSECGVAFRQEDLEKFLLDEAQPIALSQIYEAIAQHSDLIKIAEPTVTRYTTESALQRELATVREMQQGKGKVQSILSEIEIIKALEPIPLAQEQHDAIFSALNTTDQVMAWQGVAGESKTYTLNHFSQLASQSGYVVKGFTKSAEAAEVLTDQIGIEANTVASLLCSQPPEMIQDFVNPKQIWVIDEAGNLGANDTYNLLKRVKTENARLLLVANTQTRSAIEIGNPVQSLQNAGMTTVFMNQSKKQKTPELQIAVDLMANGEIDTGFERLDEAHCLIEVPEEEKIQKIVTDYLAIPHTEREKTLVLAGTNKEQLAITQGIREELGDKGHLGESVSLTQLKTKVLTKIQMCFTHHVEIGDFIMPAFNYKKRQLTKGLLYEVVAKNSDTLTLKDATGNTFTVDPFFEKAVYSQTSIEIAQGDRLKWTKNNKEKDRRNGQIFQVKAIEGTQVKIESSDGQQDTLDLSQPLHLDHALVTTTCSSQGKTADRVLISADDTISQESFYIAVSRSKYNLKVYTTDKEELLKRAKQFLAYENPLELVRAAARLSSLIQPVEDRISVIPPVRKIAEKSQAIKLQGSVAFTQSVEQLTVQKNPLELLTQNYEPRNYTNRQSSPVEPDRETLRRNGQPNSSNPIADSGNLERLCRSLNRTAIARTIGGLREVVDGINRINQQLHNGIKGNSDLAGEIGKINEQFDRRDQKTNQSARSQFDATSIKREYKDTEQWLVEVIKQKQISKFIEKPLVQLKETLRQIESIEPHNLVISQIQTLEQSIKQLGQTKLGPLQKLKSVQGQPQVDLLFPLCVEYLDANEVWEIDNYQFNFDSQTLVLTCQNQYNPDEFLSAVGTEDGWQYQEGILAIQNEENLFELLQELLEPEDEIER